MLTIEINRLISEKSQNKNKDEDIETLKREITSLTVELSLVKHQYNNIRYRTQDYEERIK